MPAPDLPAPDFGAIRRRADAATPGPWTRHGADVHPADGGGGALFTGRDGSSEIRRQADLDAEFVAHARADVLELLAWAEQRAAAAPARARF